VIGHVSNMKEKFEFWAGESYRIRDSQLKDVEHNLDRIFKENVEGLFSEEVLNSIKLLESKKCKLLLDRQNDWRLKSRTIWLNQGDQNTKFFHNYARFRESQNTNWELSNREGEKVQGFQELAELGVQYFNDIFREPERENIGEIIRVVAYFPRMVDEEDNENLYKAVSRELRSQFLRTPVESSG
jgi:hypothetical protein